MKCNACDIHVDDHKFKAKGWELADEGKGIQCPDCGDGVYISAEFKSAKLSKAAFVVGTGLVGVVSAASLSGAGQLKVSTYRKKFLENCKKSKQSIGRQRASGSGNVHAQSIKGGARTGSQLQFPRNWTALTAPLGFEQGQPAAWWESTQMVQLHEGSYEWSEVKHRLCYSIPHARLVHLARWEDRLKWKAFHERRELVLLHRGMDDGKLNEAYLWHGTGENPPEVALKCKEGLDFWYSNAGFYGRGLYVEQKVHF